MAITDLLKSVEAAVEETKARALVVEQTKAAFEAASQDHQGAMTQLETLRQELDETLRALAPNLGNPRVTVRT